jgi:hypothetical protein
MRDVAFAEVRDGRSQSFALGLFACAELNQNEFAFHAICHERDFSGHEKRRGGNEAIASYQIFAKLF